MNWIYSFIYERLIIILKMFFGRVYPPEGYFLTVKEPTLHAVCYLHWRVFFKYMYIYFQNLFEISYKQTSKIYIS